MVGLKLGDIDRDLLLIFTICYEYSLNFTNVLKLFSINKKYFWTFLEMLSPMMKLGLRKATNIRKSVDKMLPYAKRLEEHASKLTPREDRILQAFMWFVQDSFSDGEGCLHVSQVQSMPFARGYDKKGRLIAVTSGSFWDSLDRIDFVVIGGNKFYKTSRMLYYMEKYGGETTVRELNRMSVTEMLEKISDGRQCYEQATAV